ncbi:MAG: hypothetical protein K0R20_2714 [Actinomycetia bacterium]|nr:hypothetical protein [Actinomycetes bacterium]
MTELKERFSLADEIGTRDLWGEARRRAAAPEGPPRSLEWPPSIGRRIAIVGVAFAVFAVAVVFAWDLSHPEPGPRPRPAPAVDLAAELPEGWSELPAPPEVRSGAATAWTGSQLLVWGGYEYVGSNEDPDEGGFAYDATSRRWEPLPPSPLAGRSDPAFAWTGRELLIWGGWDGGFRDPPYFDDGAAFDPVAETWRMLAPAPIEGRSAFSVWTGKELIVWGSRERAGRRLDGAAYDPVTNAWRPIADGPTDITDGSAVWTGEEMIVFGAALDGNNHADTPTAIAAAYDPVTDTWRELPPSDLSPQAMTAEWVNGELIAWDYDHASSAYDPESNAWRTLTDVPLRFFECRPKIVATSRTVFGEFCGKTVVFSPEEDAWHRIPMPSPDPPGGCCSIVEPATAGDVVLVSTHFYGKSLEAVDRRMFAYNPPDVIQTDVRGEVLEPEPFIPQGAERDGDHIRLPVVFPDGTRATLVYPIALDIASLGVQPDISYVFLDDPAPRYPIVFLQDPNASIEEFVEGTEPAGFVAGSYPGIEVWEMSERWQKHRQLFQGHWVRLHLPSWTVLIALGDVDDAEEVFVSLEIQEIERFPVVGAIGRLALADGFGESEGAQLSFGDAAAEPDVVSQLDATIFLSPDGCTGGTDVNGTYGSACLANGSVFASIYGDRDFVASVVDGLRVVETSAAPGSACIDARGSTHRDRARSVAEAFLAMRIEGASEDELATALSLRGLASWRDPLSGLPPLREGYASSEIVFVDGPLPIVPNGGPLAFEIGTRLRTVAGGEVSETVAVVPGTNLSGDRCEFVVAGARSGLDGP